MSTTQVELVEVRGTYTYSNSLLRYESEHAHTKAGLPILQKGYPLSLYKKFQAYSSILTPIPQKARSLRPLGQRRGRKTYIQLFLNFPNILPPLHHLPII